MAGDVIITGKTYRLRAGSPMPIGGSGFILQTFMAEESEINNYLYTEDLPSSEDFRGQGGDLMSASFTRLLDVNAASFAGKTTGTPDIIEEK